MYINITYTYTHILKIWWTVTTQSWLPHFLHTGAYAYTCITTPVNMSTCTHTRRQNTQRHTHEAEGHVKTGESSY